MTDITHSQPAETPPPSRQCYNCGAEIVECMGFVKAGDLLEGREVIRELCGRCAGSWEWTEAGELVRSRSGEEQYSG